jgi:hypothetical protein
MVTDVIKDLEAAKAKVAELETTLAKERRQKLAGLPREFGFDNVNEFVRAVKQAAGSSRKSSGGKVSKGGKRGKRARITPEMKDKVKSMVGAGKTGAEIAESLGISVPSVQNIKKEFGLVKARK